MYRPRRTRKRRVWILVSKEVPQDQEISLFTINLWFRSESPTSDDNPTSNKNSEKSPVPILCIKIFFYFMSTQVLLQRLSLNLGISN